MKKQKMRAGAVLAAAALALALVVPAGAEAANTSVTSPYTVSGQGSTQTNSANNQVNGLTDDDLENGSASVDVQARVSGGAEIVYSLSIEFGTMEFEYDYGSTWQPSTHTYATGTSGSQAGGWVLGNVDGTNNKIHVRNDSNFPMDISFAYSPDTTMNDDPAAAGSVTGIFNTTNATLRNADLLAKGKTLVSSPLETGKLTLEMNLEALRTTTAGTTYTYYYKTSDEKANNASAPKYEGDMFFALSGKPDAAKRSDTTLANNTKIGSITVNVAPCTGATSGTLTAVGP